MARRALIPATLAASVDTLRLSPGILSGDHVFITGMTGSRPDGSMPTGIEAQTHNAMRKVGAVLAEAGLGFDAIVEMTTYHVGLRDHIDRFDAVRCAYLSAPFPAWTAVEVAGLRRDGALVEIRVIAAADGAKGQVDGTAARPPRRANDLPPKMPGKTKAAPSVIVQIPNG